MERIERNAAAKMDLHGVSRAIIPVDGEERLVYEVRGEYGGRMYFAYIDAMTGETAEIRIVTETGRGMSLLCSGIVTKAARAKISAANERRIDTAHSKCCGARKRAIPVEYRSFSAIVSGREKIGVIYGE